MQTILSTQSFEVLAPYHLYRVNVLCSPFCLHHRLRDDLKVKDKQNGDLDEELATLRSTLAAKDRALGRYKAEAESSKEKLTQTEGRLLQHPVHTSQWLKVQYSPVDFTYAEEAVTTNCKVFLYAPPHTEYKSFQLGMFSGDLANKIKELRTLEAEKSKTQSTLQGLEREADKLHRRINAAPKVIDTWSLLKLKFCELVY